MFERLQPNSEPHRLNHHREQTYVFSNNVEVMEGVKGFVPSFVWGEVFDDISYLGGEGLYEFVPFVIPARESIVTGRHGKVSIVNKSWAVALGKSHRKNVKAASDCVEVGSSFDLERERERFFLRGYNEIVRHIRWQLFDAYIDVRFAPGIEPQLKGLELGCGPVDGCLSM